MIQSFGVNPLLQATKAGILERQFFSKENFADETILEAIEAYNSQSYPWRRAKEFMTALLPLWERYDKAACVSMFTDFVEIELGLESFESDYSAHANHVIQEFLFGYNILLSCPYFLEAYDYEGGRNGPYSKFGSLFYSWMAASLFHDIGYDIQKAFEEESFRIKKNNYWSFMTQRATTNKPIRFSKIGPGKAIIAEQLLEPFKDLIDADVFSYDRFENLFKSKIEGSDWIRYDHGIISAVKYLVELKKLGKRYLEWRPNKIATLAMAVHNFRYKGVDLKLSSTDFDRLVPYLLIVSDEIQEWERERLDVNERIGSSEGSNKDAKKETKLVGILFKPTHTYVIINHRLKDPVLKTLFEDYLIKKITFQKKHFPIEVKLPSLETEILNKSIQKINPRHHIFLGTDTPISERVVSSQLPTNTQNASEFLNSIIRRKNNIDTLMSVKTEKQLLIPSNPKKYRIYVDHRIEGNPFLVTEFPF